ncbi:MAG: nucleotidyltransferase family protein [Mucilaginibacter sp.]
MKLLKLENYLQDIKALCAQHKVKHLYAFGSVLTDKFNSKSDVDFMVDFEPVEIEQYADNYYSLKFSLEDILNRPVDLLEEKAVKNPYFKQVVDSHRQLIYGY